MRPLEKIFEGATFDDFILRPQYGRLRTRDDPERRLTATSLTRRLKIRLPIIAANMATVTGVDMGKTLPLEGGIAFLPRDCAIDKQTKMLDEIKQSHSYIVENPLVLPKTATVGEARNLIHRHKISGILVESSQGSGVLAGILSHRDMPLDGCQDHKKINSVMSVFRELLTAEPGISMHDAETLMYEHAVEKLPIIDKSRRILGLITMKDIRLSKQKPYSSKDKKGRLLVGAAIGAKGDYLERASELIKHEVDCILIDLAHFDSINGKEATKTFRRKFGDFDLIGGNIATREAASRALRWGVDAVKVGIGPGYACRTRIETNFGVDQLEAIRDVYLAVGDKIPIIADGGFTRDGHLALAIAAGADSIMLGSMLAGTKESPGIVIEKEPGKKVKIYRGSTAPESVIADIHDENDIAEALRTPSEGQPRELPYTGESAVDIIGRVAGHIRSAISFSGTTNLRLFRSKFASNPIKYFRRQTPASQKESFQRKIT